MDISKIKNHIDANLFEDNEKIKEFLCCICMTPFIEPYKDSCTGVNHTFCRDCIRPTLRVNPKCPTSRVPLTFNQLTKDQATEDKMMEMKMKCPFFNRGCPWSSKMKDFSGHFVSCDFAFGNFTSKEANFEGSGGDAFEFLLDTANMDMNNIKLREIIFDFTDKFNFKGAQQRCLRTFQFVWEEKKPDGTINVIKSPKVGGKNNIENWSDKLTTYKMTDNDKINGFVFYQNEHYYPALGILSLPDCKLKTYGFHEYRKKLIPILIPENATIVGFVGKASDVIDSMAFHYYMPQKKDLPK